MTVRNSTTTAYTYELDYLDLVIVDFVVRGSRLHIVCDNPEQTCNRLLEKHPEVVFELVGNDVIVPHHINKILVD